MCPSESRFLWDPVMPDTRKVTKTVGRLLIKIRIYPKYVEHVFQEREKRQNIQLCASKA